MVWYDPTDEGSAEPSFPIPERLYQIIGSGFKYLGGYSVPVKMHVQEFAENAGDFQHFPALHSKMSIPFTSINIPFITIHHYVDWKISDDPKEHYVSYFSDTSTLLMRGRPLNGQLVMLKLP